MGAPLSAEEVQSLELGVFGTHTLVDVPSSGRWSTSGGSRVGGRE